MPNKLKLVIIAGLAISVCNSTYSKDKNAWEVNKPGGPGKDVSFNVSEGTWMNLDINPQGTEIVFDLLGDIYSMPISGGKAKLLRGGMAMEVQPRYSPDGKSILFTSDAGGGDNIWIMKTDGSDAFQVTKENFRLLNNATWTPDGEYIIARKHFTSTRSLGAGELWMYNIHGGSGLQLTSRKNDQQDVNEPNVSSDGKYIYYSEDMYPGGYFQYNKDPNNQIFVIKRYDRTNGTIETVTGGPGGAVRPQISHNGKTLAFVKRVRTKTVLYLRDLETGEEWPIYDKLSKDQQEAWTIFGIYTGFSWMPGDKEIIIWSEGKIQKIDINKPNTAINIPFECTVNQHITDVVRFKQNIDQNTFNPKVLRGAITSPDGKWLVFNAVGHLWKLALPNGKATRLTNATEQEGEPSFSPNSKDVIYVTWNDTLTGSIRITNIESGKTQILSTKKGIYRMPSFSKDGKRIVYDKEGSNNILGNAYTVKPGIYWKNIGDNNEQYITHFADNPTFNESGDRIFFNDGDMPEKKLVSCNLNGLDEKTVFTSTYAGNFTISQDKKWVAYINLHQVYIAPIPTIGKTINLSEDSSSFPVKRVSKDAGFNLHWSGDNKKLYYTLGNNYYEININDRFSYLSGKPDSVYQIPDSGKIISLSIPVDKPHYKIALTHATIITMNGNEVIADGTIIIDSNKITAIGKASNISTTGIDKIIDCSGKTIMPGLIDAHAHGSHFRNGLTPQKHWPYYANLAFGVTTMHDPSANSELVFAQSELVKSGEMVGPRVFSTGTILYGADGDFKAVINSLEDAKSAIRRTAALGAFSVKSYNQPRREQRQMVIEAARSLNIEVVPEGGSFFYHNLSMILDGHTTIEHNIPIATLYDDVIQLWKRSGTANTPTLIVCYGALNGENYWYQHTNVWENKRLLNFTPRSVIDTRSRHRTMAPEEEYENGHIQVSRSLKKLNDAGVTINMGAHGQIQGIGAHWEMWMFQQGGMTNHDVLKSATINPAKSLGLDNNIGSLEKGKLADLIILDKNPLQDIKNTQSIKYTIANGRVYDAETMKELWSNKPQPKFYWDLSKNAESFPWHEVEVEQGD